MSWRGNEFEAPGLEDLRLTLVRKATFAIISTPKIHLSPALGTFCTKSVS